MSFEAETTQQDSDSEAVELMLMLCEREVERKWKAERKYIHVLCDSE